MFFYQKMIGVNLYITARAQSAEQPVELTLNKRKNIDNVVFEVNNLFPGDAVSNDYCIKVSYEDVA